MKSPIQKEIVAGIVTLTCMGVGVIRRSKYTQDHEKLATIASATVAGHRVGATVGRLFFGPAGHLVGLTAGTVVGCVVATRRATPADPPHSEQKTAA